LGSAHWAFSIGNWRMAIGYWALAIDSRQWVVEVVHL